MNKNWEEANILAWHAVQSAIQMQQALEKLQKQMEENHDKQQ